MEKISSFVFVFLNESYADKQDFFCLKCELNQKQIIQLFAQQRQIIRQMEDFKNSNVPEVLRKKDLKVILGKLEPLKLIVKNEWNRQEKELHKNGFNVGVSTEQSGTVSDIEGLLNLDLTHLKSEENEVVSWCSVVRVNERECINVSDQKKVILGALNDVSVRISNRFKGFEVDSNITVNVVKRLKM